MPGLVNFHNKHQVSPIRALINRKNVIRPGFFLYRFCCGCKAPSRPRPEPAFSLVLDSVSVSVSHCPTEAIRSVTHLVLALGGQRSATNYSNRKERAERLLPGSLRLGFLGQQPFTLRPRAWQAAVALAWRPIPVPPGIQKTFSAGPCSFSTKELWFPASVCAPVVQPVFDSRHGRITCKTTS
jgi:hypothetical protein